MTVHAELVTRLLARAPEDTEDTPLPAPLSTTEVDHLEETLGFPLHPLLRAVYTGVGDGGFGPGYLLAPLSEAASWYATYRSDYADSEWAWPEGVLPVLDWGCGMHAAVDCRSPAGTVLLFEPNADEPDHAWYVDAPSLTAWFENHLGDSGWWVAEEAGDEVPELEPWPHARARA